MAAVPVPGATGREGGVAMPAGPTLDGMTPMGANLVAGGATFRLWAPRASEVYLLTDAAATPQVPGTGRPPAGWAPQPVDRMAPLGDGTWVGFAPGATDGTPYRFWVVGEAGGELKRDPWARELGSDPAFPDCACLVRDPTTYPWHDGDFVPPAFHDLVVYQLHVGTFYARDAHGGDRRESVATFLDVAGRVPYLASLGVTAVQLLPIQEFPWDNSLGYNNVDFFSPEMAYQVEDTPELDRHLTVVNDLLAAKGHGPLRRDQLLPGPNQVKVLVDLLHLHGVAVIVDLVYNHAGGGFDDHCLYFLDQKVRGDQDDSLYFSDRGWAGGLSFQYWTASVQDFLIRNATSFLTDFHADGIRYDEVSVIDRHGGWAFCQDLTATVRFAEPAAIQIAEYWNDRRELAVLSPPTGMGFDAALADGLRDALRATLGAAQGGAGAVVDLEAVRQRLGAPYGFADSWRAVQCIENHDLVYRDRDPRVARLADPSNTRSWYARSRARFATALLATAPGIPMFFMGQEVLEDKQWDDNPRQHPGTLVWWVGLDVDPAMVDFLAFFRALLAMRRTQPALRGSRVHAHHVDDGGRVLAFHRWIDGAGDDVVVVGTLSERNHVGYALGMPGGGTWREVFNSDAYESAVGHVTVGNGGTVEASGPPMHDMPCSASLTIPANGVLVLAR